MKVEVLQFLAYAFAHGNKWCSVRTIANHLGVTADQVTKAVEELREAKTNAAIAKKDLALVDESQVCVHYRITNYGLYLLNNKKGIL